MNEKINQNTRERNCKRVLAISHVGSWEWDYREDKFYLSEELRRILGIDKEDDKDMKQDFRFLIQKFVHPDDQQMVEAVGKNAVASGTVEKIEFRIIRATGEERWVRGEAFFSHDHNGEVHNIIGIIQDITEQKKAQIALEENLSFLQKLIATIPNPMFYKDDQGVYRKCNEAFVSYFGKKREEIIGHTVYDIAPKELADIYDKADKALMKEKGNQTYEAKVEYADGSLHDVIFNKATLLYQDGRVMGLVGVMIDVTEQKRMEEALIKSSTTDYLTQIYNRTKFLEILSEEIRSFGIHTFNLSVIMFDVDRFKSVNDTHGHDVGDKILIGISKLVNKLKREEDLFARWGGDEFMILMKDTDPLEAEKFAEKIRAKVEGHSFEGKYSVTCSLGVSYFSKGKDIEKLFKNVDKALYESKRKGRNCVSLYYE